MHFWALGASYHSIDRVEIQLRVRVPPAVRREVVVVDALARTVSEQLVKPVEHIMPVQARLVRGERAHPQVALGRAARAGTKNIVSATRGRGAGLASSPVNGLSRSRSTRKVDSAIREYCPPTRKVSPTRTTASSAWLLFAGRSPAGASGPGLDQSSYNLHP